MQWRKALQKYNHLLTLSSALFFLMLGSRGARPRRIEETPASVTTVSTTERAPSLLCAWLPGSPAPSLRTNTVINHGCEHDSNDDMQDCKQNTCGHCVDGACDSDHYRRAVLIRYSPCTLCALRAVSSLVLAAHYFGPETMPCFSIGSSHYALPHCLFIVACSVLTVMQVQAWLA